MKTIKTITIIEITVAIFSLVIIVISLLNLSFIKLNENQVLYLFSTAAEVIAGLFALTLAGYIFFTDRLNREVQANDTLYDAVESLKDDYYKLIKKMGIVFVLSIIFCITNIALNSFLLQKETIHIFMLNEGILLFLMETAYIIVFVVSVSDPNKIKNISKFQKYIFDKNETGQGDLAEFIKYFNMTEHLILSSAEKLITNGVTIQPNDYRKYRPQILQALKILQSKKILDKSLISQFDELRKYRNYTVHSSEPNVSNSMCDKIKALHVNVKVQIDKYFGRLSE